MRSYLRLCLNGFLRPFGVRSVNRDWGPRGFASAFERLARHGIRAEQIVDVGAASGKWTLECLRVFPDSRYLCVDPLEENRKYLDAIAKLNPNISIWIGALGSRAGLAAFHEHGDQSSFFPSQYSYDGTLRHVGVRTLDSFLDTAALDPPDLIKLDVQGYEMEVLRGAGRCLQKSQVLLVEVSYRQIYQGSPLAHDVIAFLGDAGFRIYDICSYVQRPSDGELCQSDIVFVRQGTAAFNSEEYR